MLFFFFLFAAIKINCCGFCGVTNKVNDTSWNVEEQYFNNTISVADKGMLHLATAFQTKINHPEQVQFGNTDIITDSHVLH